MSHYADVIPDDEMLVRVVAPHFVAGVVLRNGIVTQTAPILRWCLGGQRWWLREQFAKRGWKASVLRCS